MVVQGLIRPPPEIRVVADRTALYVAKNGRTFETRILNSAKGQTPKFAFLHATSPFHAYYEDRIQFYEKNGGVEEETKEIKDKGEEANTGGNGAATNTESTGPTDEDKTKVTQTQRASAIDPISKALLTQRTKISEFYKKNAADPVAQTTTDSSTDPSSGDGQNSAQPSTTTPPPPPTAILPPPPTLNLVQIVAPASLTMIQLETIQVTAQLIAMSHFVNPSTNLLHALTIREWNNPIFRFCQPRHGHFAYFSALVDAYKQILADWSSAATTTTTLWSIKNTSARVKEIEAMANNVDRCLEVAAYRAEYQRDMEERLRNDEPAMANNKVDWHDFVVVETIDFAVDEVVANLPPPTTPSLLPNSIPIPPAPYTVPAKADSDMDDDDDDEGEMIRVVPTYTPKISGVSDNSNTVVVDPISGKTVAVKDMPEHMRIQLLDPKWAEERKRFQEKQKESNLVSGDMVASNLERFAQARGDRFGKKEQNVLSQEAESKKRLEEANRIIREQGDIHRTVGPTLPGNQQKHTMSLPPPISGGTLDEPAAKRPKIVTYAPSVLQPPGVTAPSLPSAIDPTVIEDPFALAATGVPMSSSTLDNQDLIPEAEFAASLPKLEMTLQIRVPNDPTHMAWNFYGQIVSISTNVMTQVKVVKSELSSIHLNGLPTNKIQLKNPATGAFLKDNFTLAAHNISPSTTLELVPRARGGKKK